MADLATADVVEHWLAAVAELKRCHWDYSLDAQVSWFLAQVAADERHVMAWRGDDLVGYVRLPFRSAVADGRACRVIGVSNVVVRPDARGLGIGDRMLGVVAASIAAHPDAIGLLQCRRALIAYYSRNGWAEFHGDIRCRSEGGERPFRRDECAMIHPDRQAGAIRHLAIAGDPF